MPPLPSKHRNITFFRNLIPKLNVIYVNKLIIDNFTHFNSVVTVGTGNNEMCCEVRNYFIF